jgi:two-component system response regulator RegX3
MNAETVAFEGVRRSARSVIPTPFTPIERGRTDVTQGEPRKGTPSATDRVRERGGRTTILVVEDEESYQEALLAGLSREGYHVELASDGLEALQWFVEHPPDLVVLDLLLPSMSGIEVCRRMRAVAPVPIIMVSALDSETDIVRGLELGAEDYIAKPYRLRELVARIRSVLRRVAPPSPVAAAVAPTEHVQADFIVAGPFHVNFARRVVTRDGEPIHLSRREFDLLALLLSPPGQVRTREEVIDTLWSGRELSDTRTLDTHIRRLRIKLEPEPGRPRYLVTVRGVGFRFEP